MATLTFEVPESVASALQGHPLTLADVEGLMRDELIAISEHVRHLGERTDDPDPAILREVAARLACCADALEAVA